MKKLLVLLLLVMILSSCSSNTIQTTPLGSSDFYTPQITDGIFFERLSDVKHNIYISENDAVSENTVDTNRMYVAENVLVFRYAYDNGFLVYHWNNLDLASDSSKKIRFMNGIEYEIKDDIFTVYDVSKNEYFDFANQNDMLEFCEKEKIKLAWKYSNGFTYEIIAQTQGDIKWSVLKSTSESLTGFILKNDEIIYEGYISDVYSDNENVLAFKLEIPSKKVLEFRNLKYNDISVSFDEVVKQRRELLFMKEDIYYSRYIIINVADEIVSEYDDAFKFKKALKTYKNVEKSDANQTNN